MIELTSVSIEPGPQREIPSLDDCCVVVQEDINRALLDARKGGQAQARLSGITWGWAAGQLAALAVVLLTIWGMPLWAGLVAFTVLNLPVARLGTRQVEGELRYPFWSVVDFATAWQAKMEKGR